MKRVLHITGGLDKNGTETFIMNLYRNINKEKIQFDFLVFTSAKDGYYEEALSLGARIYHLPKRRNGLFTYLKSIKEFMYKNVNQYAAVHMSSCTLTTIAPVFFAKKYGARKVIIHSHSTQNNSGLHNRILHFINTRFIANIADVYLACSEEAADWFYKCQKARRQAIIVKNGVDLLEYKFKPEIREKMRKKLMLSNKVVYANISRFEVVKNHLFIIEVFSQILKKQSNAVLLLVGEGPLEEDIKRRVAEKGLQKNVFFLGFRDDVGELLNAIDAILFPSLFEGVPFSLIEAQSCGLPVFTSTSVSVNVNLTDRVYFYDLSEGAVVWADKILRQLSSIAALNRDTSNQVEEKGYSISKTASLLESIYLN